MINRGGAKATTDMKICEDRQNSRIRKPTNLQVILHTKNQARSVYYFTHGRKIKPKASMGVGKSPFYIPKNIQDFSYRTRYREDHTRAREIERGYNHSNRPNYRTRLNEDKLERLLVPQPPSLSEKPVSHPEFHNIVAGRPIRDKFAFRSYLCDLRELFLVRLKTGYLYDETYLAEEQHRKEKERLQDIQRSFQFYADCYDKFLAEDHSSSIVLLKEAEHQLKRSKTRHEKIWHLMRIWGWYRGKILVLDEQWRIGKIYQAFLYQVAPLWWRNKYDCIHRQKTGELDASVYGGKTASLNTVHSVGTIIEEFLQNVARSEPPVLYFQNPNELHQIFHEMEVGNLLALLQCEELTPPANQMVLGLEKARSHFVAEVKILREHMKALEEEVIFEENRSRECEKKARAISFGLFRDLIVDRNTLNLYVNVEDCYEVCVAPNDGNLSLLMMMKGIEYKQETLMSALDNQPNEIVLKALATCYREDAKVLREAQEATKTVNQIENLMKTLRKSLEPRREGKIARRALWRSDPPKEKMDMPIPPNPLTEEELEYLHLFTNFCEATDDPELGKEIYAQRTKQ